MTVAGFVIYLAGRQLERVAAVYFRKLRTCCGAEYSWGIYIVCRPGVAALLFLQVFKPFGRLISFSFSQVDYLTRFRLLARFHTVAADKRL